jgi:hypothetical protein
MADQYISKYSNGKAVSPAQYITELICENRAKQRGDDLHYRFWLNKTWEAYYRNQIASAHKLLTKYSPEAVIAALKSIEAKKIYSLRAPHLIPIIESQDKLLKSQNTNMTILPDRKINKTFESSQSKSKNVLSKLKELDNEY